MLIKAVVGLFAGIGMVLGSLVGQGLAKSEHRQKFANTFFALNQTDESLALDEFKPTCVRIVVASNEKIIEGQ